jgi:integrase
MRQVSKFEISEFTNPSGEVARSSPSSRSCLFAGIRPDLYQGEISKLKPEHVRLDIGVITIERDVSKVRMKRTVTIQPNLLAWLRAYPLD